MISIFFGRKLIIYVFVLVVIIFTNACLYGQSFKIKSAKYYKEKVNVGCSIISTPDDNLFIAGYVQNSIHKNDLYILRLTKELDTIWTKQIDCNYLNTDPTILYISSNRLLVLGNYGCNGFIIVMDENGKILVRKTIKYKNKCISIFDGLVLKGKGFVLVGATYGSAENRKAYVTFTDTNGAPIWEKEYDLGKITNAKSVLINKSDKNSIIVGCENNINTYLLNLDLDNGSLKWEKEISKNWIINSICATSGGNYLLVGDAEGSTQPDRASWSEGIIFKVNANGDILWSKENNYRVENSFCSIKSSKRNYYIISGYKWAGMGIYNFTLTTFDNLSDSIETYTYSDSMFSIAKDICISNSGEYFITGSTFNYNVETDEQSKKLYVVRFKLLSQN